MAFLGGQPGGVANKITKSKGKVVKPILKKLSHSEKNSLDLDRGWDEQQVEQLVGDDWEAKDVSFGFAGGLGANDSIVAAGAGSGFRPNPKFQHGRSGSQTSAGSGPRGGAFVHPFAQTPRTSTPPLSYANSLASFDNGRDCSPTITENEDNSDFQATATPNLHSHAHSHTFSQPQLPAASQSTLRRPSLNSQRTSSFPDIPASNPPSLRIITGRSVSGTTATSSRFVPGSLPTGSHSDLHVNAHSLSVSAVDTLDSPTGSLRCGGSVSASHQQQSHLPPLRASLDMGQFPRLRSRSELDTATRQENIRIARRKFEERERAKEEKYDREMIRKRERRENKEATRIEKGEAPSRPSFHRKRTPTALSTVSAPTGAGVGANSSPVGGLFAHSTSRLASSAPAKSGGVGLGIGRRRHTDNEATDMYAQTEKPVGFASRRYDSVPVEAPPSFGVTVHDVQFEQTRPRRGSSAKRKTQSYWHGFLLWLRTKLLRLSRH
ncbi:24d7cf6d-100d-4944-8f16-842025984f67 [Thermothielavioides terrestris]|jgi:hypothetical protein|uniref:Uncharacterized protein n=2 Tax=Thermothielavioides terrestris TaxID=2587410 RepID=G2RDQ4_THETT|nr:uncharacterized protein THITE_2120763 [Thermothielavioides terrestris NRRL 8126]AEO69985.1 hypothetical protein THITE_2120763 [Thermothielavioides terrestris NRRL 8126]SPQ17782.1 24d7cf6d-100d-4944-8f16-842025984f67 [Thermothielavioides terrestris]